MTQSELSKKTKSDVIKELSKGKIELKSPTEKFKGVIKELSEKLLLKINTLNYYEFIKDETTMIEEKIRKIRKGLSEIEYGKRLANTYGQHENGDYSSARLVEGFKSDLDDGSMLKDYKKFKNELKEIDIDIKKLESEYSKDNKYIKGIRNSHDGANSGVFIIPEFETEIDIDNKVDNGMDVELS